MKLLWVLAALLAARAALTFVPSMSLWGWNVQRFLSPLAAWLPWILAALACVPAIARRMTPPLERFGEALSERTTLALLTFGIGAAALVWLIPDRALWVGDSLVRLGGIRSELTPETISPQTLPLDAWLHYTLPQWLVTNGWFDASGAVRWLGAMEAGALAVLAGLFALAIDTSPAGRAAAALVTFFGGHLCLLTGESKAFGEVCLAVAALAALGLRALRDGRGLLAMGAVTAVAIAAHRLALGLLPGFLAAWILAWRAPEGRRASRPLAIAGLLLPLAMVAVLAPRLWRTFVSYDVPSNFLGGAAAGQAAAALVSPTRLLDLASALLMLSPLAVAIPFLGDRGSGPTQQSKRGPTSRHEGVFLAVLAAPFLLAAFLARPPQGLIRDWDGLGAAGLSLSLLAAWGIARALRRSASRWLAAPAIACAAAFTLQWLLHYNDRPRVTDRIEAFLREPPARPAYERARAWDFVGWRRFQREEWDAAAAAFDSAASLGPTPRMLTQLAMAESMRQNYAVARQLYNRAVAADSNYAVAWTGVAVAAIWFEDLEDTERAARHLLRLKPDDPKTREILTYIASVRSGAAPPSTGTTP